MIISTQPAGQLGSKLKELREVEGERNKLRAANQDLERQAERLNRKLSAQPKVAVGAAIHFSQLHGLRSMDQQDCIA